LEKDFSKSTRKQSIYFFFKTKKIG
jgi:hypothetical protein